MLNYEEVGKYLAKLEAGGFIMLDCVSLESINREVVPLPKLFREFLNKNNIDATQINLKALSDFFACFISLRMYLTRRVIDLAFPDEDCNKIMEACWDALGIKLTSAGKTNLNKLFYEVIEHKCQGDVLPAIPSLLRTFAKVSNFPYREEMDEFFSPQLTLFDANIAMICMKLSEFYSGNSANSDGIWNFANNGVNTPINTINDNEQNSEVISKEEYEKNARKKWMIKLFICLVILAIIKVILKSIM